MINSKQAGKEKKKKVKRICLTREQKFKILLMHHYKCAYCDIPLTAKCEIIAFDHFIPVSVCYSNRLDNFVPSCVSCNTIKGSHVFDNLLLARAYVNKIRKSNGLPFLQSAIHSGEEVAEVLQPSMSHVSVVEEESSFDDETAQDNKIRLAQEFLDKCYAQK